jgi:hypothetical protein
MVIMNVKILTELDACHEAVEWARKQPDWGTHWNNCERGDWMLWLIGKTIAGEPMSNERKPLVLAACDCAELVLKYVSKGEERLRKAIEIARKWANGDDSISKQGIKAAAHAAHAAHAAAYAAYASYAAYAAYASYAAYAYAAAARKEVLKQCADIVRKYYPQAPKL